MTKYPSIPSLKELLSEGYELRDLVFRINSYKYKFYSEKVDGINSCLKLVNDKVDILTQGGVSIKKKNQKNLGG